MATNQIPFTEIKALIRLSLEAFNIQFNRKILFDDIQFQFIPARRSTRIGFEISTKTGIPPTIMRIYAVAFRVIPSINPYILEENQNQPGDLGVEVYVSLSDLPLSLFPILSKTTSPIYDNSAPIQALELEDLSGYILTEDDRYITTEDGP